MEKVLAAFVGMVRLKRTKGDLPPPPYRITVYVVLHLTSQLISVQLFIRHLSYRVVELKGLRKHNVNKIFLKEEISIIIDSNKSLNVVANGSTW